MAAITARLVLATSPDSLQWCSGNSQRLTIYHTCSYSCIHTRLDFGNSALAGLSSNVLKRLQSVVNAAARVIFVARKFEHITPLLRELHWLRIPQLIDFKLGVLVFYTVWLHDTSPTNFIVWRTQTPDDSCAPYWRRPSLFCRHVTRPSVTGCSVLRHPCAVGLDGCDREPDVANIMGQVNQWSVCLSQPGEASWCWEARFQGLGHTGQAQHT